MAAGEIPSPASLAPLARAIPLVMAVGAGLSCEPAPESRKPPDRVVSVNEADLPRFAEAELVRGRAVWLRQCRKCHLEGQGGAPRILDRDAWKPRIAQGKDVLVRHAIEGFEPVRGGIMPSRGGDPALSDDEVKAAVNYVLAVAG